MIGMATEAGTEGIARWIAAHVDRRRRRYKPTRGHKRRRELRAGRKSIAGPSRDTRRLYHKIPSGGGDPPQVVEREGGEEEGGTPPLETVPFLCLFPLFYFACFPLSCFLSLVGDGGAHFDSRAPHGFAGRG